MQNDYFSAVGLGIVEGLTEFLPVSSTGHLIIAEKFFNLSNIPVSSFLVIIQLGAILAVVFLYFKKLFLVEKTTLIQNWQLIIISFIPAGILGFLLGDLIDKYLFNPKSVAFGLLIGSALLLWAQKLQKKLPPPSENQKTITKKQALIIGFFQIMALFPGVSRSGASITGAIYGGVSKDNAVEFSFLMAIPVIFGASLYSFLKNPQIASPENIGILLVGMIVSFISAILAIKFFIKITQKTGFYWFILYRLLLAVLVLVFL